MLITHTRLQGAPILSLQTGTPLAETSEAIIDPRQLTVVAFYCVGPNVSGTAILHTSDIREFGNMGIIVDGANVLMPPDDLVRLREVLDFNFTLVGKQVVDSRRRKLGKVEGYSIDPESFYIMKLNVRRPLMKSFLNANLLIDRTQILEINNKHIMVDSGEVRTEKEMAAPQVIDNPFRRQHTAQPDGSPMEVGRE